MNRGTTGIAGIHRHIGLDEGHVTAVRQGARLGRDDAGAGAVLEAEGGADGQHPFTDPGIAGAAHLHRGQVLGRNLEHGHIAGLVQAHHLGLELPLVVELDGNLVGAVHHVSIGQDGAVGRDDETGTKAAHRHLALLAGHPEMAEEFVKGIIRIKLAQVRPVIAGLAVAGHADIDHRRPVTGDDAAHVRQGGHRHRCRGTDRRRDRGCRLGLAHGLQLAEGIGATQGRHHGQGTHAQFQGFHVHGWFLLSRSLEGKIVRRHDRWHHPENDGAAAGKNKEAFCDLL